MTHPGRQPPADDDPFERLVLDENFVRSAEISEISAKQRAPKPPPSRKRPPKAKRARSRSKRTGGPRWGGGGSGDRMRAAAQRPATNRMPEWTPRQWIVTALVALGAVAYLYVGLGGPT